MKTFNIGGAHPNDNKISKDAAIEDFPIVKKAYIPMAQHIGAPAKPIVAVGDYVKVGQKIAEAGGFISANIHSSVSGKVLAIKPVADLAGRPVNTIIVNVEGDEWLDSIDRSPEINSNITLSGKEIIDKVKECGVVGMGGASFPTNVKLSPPPGNKAEFLLINCAECEPYLTSDYRLMLEQPEQIFVGAAVIMKALNVDVCKIGVEENKPDAIAKLQSFESKYTGIKVVPLKKKYPQGGEKQLIQAMTGRYVGSGKLPISVGAVVQNCATAIAVYEAVQKNKPLFEGVITVTGDCLPVQKNLKLRVGTPMNEIMDYIGGVPEEAVKLISGGPMMGKAIANLNAPTVKASSAILALTADQTLRKEESNCIRCGKCIDACPMGLEPYLLIRYTKRNNLEELEKNDVFDCIECGCCLYTCPANIPLLDYIRVGKADVMGVIRGRAAAKRAAAQNKPENNKKEK